MTLVLRVSKELRVGRGESLHGRNGHSLHRQNKTRHNQLFPVILWCIRRTVQRIEDEPHIFAGKMFYPRKSRDVSIRNRNGFHERNIRHLRCPPCLENALRTSGHLFGQLANQYLALAYVTIRSPQDSAAHGCRKVNCGVMHALEAQVSATLRGASSEYAGTSSDKNPAPHSQSAATPPADEPEASPTPTPNASGTLSDDFVPTFLKREVA